MVDKSHESLLGFMVSTLGEYMDLKTFEAGNFKMTNGHSAHDVKEIIANVVT